MRSDLNYSVVVPLYNNRDYIVRAVESALNQNYPALEVIVVDDGSTDGGGEEVARIGNEKVRLVRQDNAGVGAARNAGVASAKGAWIAFLDADDAWYSEHLEEMCELIKSFPDAALIGTSYVELHTAQNPGPKNLGVFRAKRRRVDYFREASKNIGFIWTSAAAVKKDVFNDVGGFGASRTGQDTEFWARVALDYPVAASNRITSVYYRGTGGVIEGLKSEAAPTGRLESLPEVAPVINMLCQRSETDPDLFESDSVRAYINGRLLLGIRSNVLKGRLSRARSFAALMVKPLERRFFFWKIFMMLPAPFIKGVVWVHGLAKAKKR